MNSSNPHFVNQFSVEDDMPGGSYNLFNPTQEIGFNDPDPVGLYGGMMTNNLNSVQNVRNNVPMINPEISYSRPTNTWVPLSGTMGPSSVNAYAEEGNNNIYGTEEVEFYRPNTTVIGRRAPFNHYDETNNPLYDMTEVSNDFRAKDYMSCNVFTSRSNFEGQHFHTDSSVVKRKPGKNPFSQPKDVRRHFLKVHMKKCLAYAIENTDSARIIIESKIVNHAETLTMPFFLLEPAKYYATLQKDFKTWLLGLKSKFKDYGKEDFKAAYLNDRKSFRKTIESELTDDKKMEEFLKKSKAFIIWIFKETFQILSLRFVNNEGPGGLKSQLADSANILDEKEHFQLLKLTRWLLEKPERIETSEIFGKRWVENFLQERMEQE